jgi:hypothetical protein
MRLSGKDLWIGDTLPLVNPVTWKHSSNKTSENKWLVATIIGAKEWLKLLVYGDSTPGFRHGKTNSVRSRVKELMPFPSLSFEWWKVLSESWDVKSEDRSIGFRGFAIGLLGCPRRTRRPKSTLPWHRLYKNYVNYCFSRAFSRWVKKCDRCSFRPINRGGRWRFYTAVAFITRVPLSQLQIALWGFATLKVPFSSKTTH